MWTAAATFEDIRYETSGDGIAKITINRPEVRNAFRPQTIVEISQALELAREDPDVGAIILTGEGELAFCSGGDQRVRGDTGYVPEGATVGRFHVTDLHVQMRRLPKPIIAMVAGYAVGGGQILHLVCDLSIAADNARFGQTGPRVGSFDGGFGAALLAKTVGLRKAKEIWFLCRQYDAQQALDMGLVNTVVPLERLEEETVAWCREMLSLSPFALRLLKASFHAAEDGLAGIQQLAHDANLLFYATEEAAEGREAFKAKRAARLLQVPAAAVSSGVAADRPSALRIWLMAARPRTLPAAVAPVLVGTALAATQGTFKPLTFVAAMLGALFIQVGTNLSNDYSDARRGADTEDRLGPVRVTAGGLVPPRQVLIATYIAFGAAVLAGVVPDRDRGLGAAARRRRLDPRRRALHRRAAAVRLRGPRRGVRVPVLRRRRRGRLVLRADRGARLGGVRAGDPGRAAGRGDPRRQQRARPRDRPAGGQANARGAARARSGARGLYGGMLAARVRDRAAAVAVRRRRARRLAAAALARDPARAAGRQDRARAHRRAGAQRRAGQDGDAPARLLHAAVVGLLAS